MLEETGINNTLKSKFLIVILGPTGTGKSRLAIHIAQKFNGEIVNADSRQVYRYMNIGTAKPSKEELEQVPHHLFNIIDPDEVFSLAQYQDLANKSIKSIQKRQSLPVLVGGSGQYIWAVVEGWEIPRIPPDQEFRRSLEKLASENGIDYLYQRLTDSDPVAAKKIDQRNIRRVIRAMEVAHEAQEPISKLQNKKAPDFNILIIGLTAEREVLYQRIDFRVDDMIRRGLINEINKLNQMNYGFELSSMNSIGYKQIGSNLRGEISQEEAIRQIKTNSHRFVRHQYAWFHLDDPRIHWFNIQNEIETEIFSLVANFLEEAK